MFCVSFHFSHHFMQSSKKEKFNWLFQFEYHEFFKMADFLYGHGTQNIQHSHTQHTQTCVSYMWIIQISFMRGLTTVHITHKILQFNLCWYVKIRVDIFNMFYIILFFQIVRRGKIWMERFHMSRKIAFLRKAFITY